MTNVSTNNINTKDYEIAFTELTTYLVKLKNSNAAFFVNELLTPTECIMIVKRFATILMFKNNFSAYRASEVLGLSLSTTHGLYQKYKRGQYNGLLGNVQKKDQNRFLSLIEDLIMAQVSPRARARIYNRLL